LHSVLLVRARSCLSVLVCALMGLSASSAASPVFALGCARLCLSVLVYVCFVFIRTCSNLLGLPFVPTLCAWLCWSPLPARICLALAHICSCSSVLIHARPCSFLLSFALVRACSRSFVCMFALVCTHPAVCLYLLGVSCLFVHSFMLVRTCPCSFLLSFMLVCAHSHLCLFVLVRTRLGSFVCIKYTVSTHYNEETHLCNISNLDKDIWLVFDM
jgi:hypothetical protein